VSIWVLILSNILVFQLVYFNKRVSLFDITTPHQVSSTDSLSYALSYPKGTAVALPSVPVSKEEDKRIKREIYGGKGDAKHLGGFTEIDTQGISPAAWKHMVTYFGVKSLLDVGCGRGISTSWFVLHGVDALCVEGSHDAVANTMLPDPSKQIVEHDFSRGPWWPSHTVDAVWCVEFLEHVGRNFHHNYLPAFRKAALIFATNSRWGGWHHVEVHDDIWWISKFQSYGFIYSPELSEMVRRVARKEIGSVAVSGTEANPQHIYTTMKVREGSDRYVQWKGCWLSYVIFYFYRFMSILLWLRCRSTRTCLRSMAATTISQARSEKL
jgi:hypothetical protein